MWWRFPFKRRVAFYCHAPVRAEQRRRENEKQRVKSVKKSWFITWKIIPTYLVFPGDHVYMNRHGFGQVFLLLFEVWSERHSSVMWETTHTPVSTGHKMASQPTDFLKIGLLVNSLPEWSECWIFSFSFELNWTELET